MFELHYSVDLNKLNDDDDLAYQRGLPVLCCDVTTRHARTPCLDPVFVPECIAPN